MDTAKTADSIFGNKLYQKRARIALPLLVLQAESKNPITYLALIKKMKMPNARNLNYVLGSIGQALESLSKKWDEPIPPIQSLVINKNTLLPGPGFYNFLKSKNSSKLSWDEKRMVIDELHQSIYSYKKWKEVLKGLSLLSVIKYIFERGEVYSRKDVYKILGLPTNTGGKWNTGYTKFKDDAFIFCNLGTPGRGGHDYGNRFDGEDLIWFGKTDSKISHPTIQDLLKPKGKIYVFWRSDNVAKFTYAGAARHIKVMDETPVKIIWKFDDPSESHPEMLPEEEGGEHEEGGVKQITVNAYERNPQARAECLRHYGYKCSVCKFDFYEVYGEIGKGFIHVHHLKLISKVGKKHIVDPIKDLRPVCPNCHAMIHIKREPYTIEELNTKIRRN
jgi:hypothetical protein